jgi:ABC-type multidrug transport system ATPase subunit
MSVVNVQSVSKSFQEIDALTDISFAVAHSEIFGVIGPDGAGKTTLFRMIASLLLPDNGEIRVKGFDTDRDYQEIRKIIGYMAGRFSLYHDLSVEENLKFYSTVFNAGIEDNYDLIKDIYQQIEPFKKRKAGALSGGMKQKLALSCALIHRPELLILDEPTTGVDAVSRMEFWDMLHSIRKQGISVIVSTPYMDEASKCDRVALIQKGKILSLSEPDKIADHFSNLLFSVRSQSSNYKLLLKIRQKEWCSSAWLFGQDIHVSLKKESEEAFRNDMHSSGEVDSISRINPGIEDTFIDLMIK